MNADNWKTTDQTNRMLHSQTSFVKSTMFPVQRLAVQLVKTEKFREYLSRGLL